jgi:hypothetical protein
LFLRIILIDVIDIDIVPVCCLKRSINWLINEFIMNLIFSATSPPPPLPPKPQSHSQEFEGSAIPRINIETTSEKSNVMILTPEITDKPPPLPPKNKSSILNESNVGSVRESRSHRSVSQPPPVATQGDPVTNHCSLSHYFFHFSISLFFLASFFLLFHTLCLVSHCVCNFMLFCFSW